LWVKVDIPPVDKIFSAKAISDDALVFRCRDIASSRFRMCICSDHRRWFPKTVL